MKIRPTAFWDVTVRNLLKHTASQTRFSLISYNVHLEKHVKLIGRPLSGPTTATTASRLRMLICSPIVSHDVSIKYGIVSNELYSRKYKTRECLSCKPANSVFSELLSSAKERCHATALCNGIRKL